MEKEIKEYQLRINEYNDAINKIVIKKQQLKSIIDKIENDIKNINNKSMIKKFLLTIIGIKVLPSNNNSLKLQLFNRIIIIIHFTNNDTNNFIIKSIKYQIIKFPFNEKIFDDKNIFEMINLIYEQSIINNIFPINDAKITLENFIEKLTFLIKYTSSYLYFINILMDINSLGQDISMGFDKEKKIVQLFYSLYSKCGGKIIFRNDINILDSFLGLEYKQIEAYNISISCGNFIKYKQKVELLSEEIKKYFTNKNKNPLFFKDFLNTLNNNVINLND